MAKTLTTWTVEDYHRMIAAGVLVGRQVELLGGQIIDMAPELPIHRATYRRGSKYLETLFGDRATVFSAAPVTLPNDGEPQPDLAIVRSPESRYDERHPCPEDIYWLIEVSNSSLAYDLGEKAGYYARDRIQEYWVVDIAHHTLWVHRQPTDHGYQQVQAFTSGTVSPLSFPDIAVELGRFWG
jgi:Uma2 family endonuclease